MADRLYADHAATTPLSGAARNAMQPWLSLHHGNPSSLYAEGRRAKAALDEARETLSIALGCLFGEVIFTSSGTEAANLALIGAALAGSPQKRPVILVSSAEHHCVLSCGPLLHQLGHRVQMIPVDRFGCIELDALESLLGDQVLLVAAMQANNELGTIQDVRPIAELAHRHGALLFCDAVQSFAHGDLNVDALGADFLAVSAHKLYGPKGVGALVIRGGSPCDAVLLGGGQERDMRAGTENVAGIVGFAAAVEDRTQHDDAGARVAAEAFFAELEARMTGWRRTVPAHLPTLPGFVHVLIDGIDAETLLIRLDRAGLSASAGAACSSGSLNPSHVLVACGYSEAEARTGIRLTFGRGQSEEQGKDAARRVAESVTAMRR